MKVELEKTWPMPADAATSWAFLQDIEGVAGCMPGAKITEKIDEAHYKGAVSVKVGPASMSFKGEIEVAALDAATRTLHLIGKGSDAGGTSGATMDLVATVVDGETPGTSRLVGKSEVSMSGKAAAFGGRMMGTVADQILKQFADNFAGQVKARATPQASDGAAAAASTAASGDAHAEPARGSGAAPAAAPVPAKELNALALFWAIVRDWFRGLFRRRTA